MTGCAFALPYPHTPCHAAQTATSCCANRHVMLRKPPRHAAQTTPSCCAQSQHPEMPVERSESRVSGFCDYARNDEVEDPTLGCEHRDITLRTPPALSAHPPALRAHSLRCPPTPCAVRTPPAMRRKPPRHAARSRSIQKPPRRSQNNRRCDKRRHGLDVNCQSIPMPAAIDGPASAVVAGRTPTPQA